MKRVFALALAMALLAGCAGRTDEPLQPPPALDDAGAAEGAGQTADAPAETPDAVVDMAGDEAADAAADFGVKLFQNCLGGGNTLVSPLSVLEAMAMAANGAAGDTLTQMEDAFGADLDSLNAWLYAWVHALPDAEGGAVHVANSLWLNDSGKFTVAPDFLQINAAYYGADVYEEPFVPALADEINAWVSEHTAGRIEQIVDEVPADAMTYLVNALSFDGAWEDVYREDQVRAGAFTAADGSERDADFMSSTEQMYLEDGHAAGFIKYYEGRQLAFAALLPEEGMSVEDYAAALTGSHLRRLLSGAREDVLVDAAIPKFSSEYGAELSRVLAAMGIEDAFDMDKADFSRLGKSEDGNIYISRVMHKCTIDVHEKGTEAGAATALEIRAAGMAIPGKPVYLDRPFVYMLIDCAANVPIFIGAVTDLE